MTGGRWIIAAAAAGSMAFALTQAPAIGQSGSLEAEVAALVDTAIEQWQVVLTCSATDPRAYEAYRGMWDEEVSDGVEEIRNLGLDAVAADLETRSDLSGFMTDAPFAEVVAFCHAAGDWRRRIAMFQMVYFESALEDLVEEFGE